MSEKSVEVLIRPTAYVIGAILTVLITIFIGFISLFTNGGCLWGLTSGAWDHNWIGDISFVLFWPLVLAALATLLSKFGLTKHELVVIMAMVWISWMLPTHYGVNQVVLMMGTARQIPGFHLWNLNYGKVIAWQWGPDPFNDKLWESWMYGGPVPWAEWMPALLLHIARLIPYYLGYAFMLSLWRRQWVDVEALPFPHATAAAKLIDMAYEKVDGRTRLFQNVWLWLGLLVGFLAIMPYWGWTLPVLGMAQLREYGGMAIDLTPYVIIPLAPLSFNFEAFWIGAALLVPLKTLFSYIVTAVIVHWIWWPIMSWLGYWEPQSAGTSGITEGSILEDVYYEWTGPNMQKWVYTWGSITWLSFGVGFGFIFYPVFVAFRSELLNTLKAIIGKAPREVEAKEPMRYTYMFIGFIVCALIYVISWWYASLGYLPIVFGFIWYILNGLYYGVARAKVAGEFGLVLDPFNDNMWAHIWDNSMRLWWVADTASPFFIRDVKERFIVLRGDYPWYSTFIRAAPTASLLQSYKVASIEGVHSRYIFIGAVIAVIVGVITSIFTLLPMWCNFGALNLAAFNYTGAPNNYQQRAPTYTCRTEVGVYWRFAPPVGAQWIQFAIGLVIISVVYALHAKYPWFPLSPGGVAMGFGWIIVNMVFPAIIAYIVKLIILRIGGTKLYDDLLMPFAIGMTAAVGIAVILGALYHFASTLSAM
ncbi:MAG: DUF6785 family protein [Candidatus Bathyarchaeia archaeon]